MLEAHAKLRLARPRALPRQRGALSAAAPPEVVLAVVVGE